MIGRAPVGLFILSCMMGGLLNVSPIVAQELPTPLVLPNADDVSRIAEQLARGQTVTPIRSQGPVGEDVEGLWRGNRPEISLSFPRIEISLMLGEKPFTIELQESEDHVVVRHSRPARPQEAGGLRLRKDVPELSRYFYDAHDGLSVMFMLAPNTGPDLMALMMCPRDYKPVRFVGDRPHLVATSAQLNGAVIEAKGSGSAYLLGGREAAFASLRFKTSDQILPPKVAEDKIVGRDPRVSLRYIPELSEGESLGLARSGMLWTEIDLRLPSEHRRRSLYEQAVWLLDAQWPLKTDATARQKRVFLDPGPCFLVFRQLTVVEHYDVATVPNR